MGFHNPGDETLRQLFRSSKIVAVVGLSPKFWRPSHGVARALQQFGYRIVPVVGRLPRAKRSEASFGETDKSDDNPRPERPTFAPSPHRWSRHGGDSQMRERIHEPRFQRVNAATSPRRRNSLRPRAPGRTSVPRSGAPPMVKEVLGETAYASLEDVPVKIDLVDVFRAPGYADAIVDSCIKLDVSAIWFQEGVINESAARRAETAGITVVMDRCTYKDYVRLFAGGSHTD